MLQEHTCANVFSTISLSLFSSSSGSFVCLIASSESRRVRRSRFLKYAQTFQSQRTSFSGARMQIPSPISATRSAKLVRASAVTFGMGMRRKLPSTMGFKPRDALEMAFCTAGSSCWSNTETISMLPSRTAACATPLKGNGAPPYAGTLTLSRTRGSAWPTLMDASSDLSVREYNNLKKHI